MSVDGEWSFAQTLRHLVMATDTWLGRAILQLEQPYHPIGQPNAGASGDGLDLSIFVTEPPSYDDVLAVRAERVAMVSDFLAAVTPEQLARAAHQPVGAAVPGDRPVVPAHDPRGGVGAPPLRRPRPRHPHDAVTVNTPHADPRLTR